MAEIPELVKLAMLDTITNIGQLSTEDIKVLDKYVRMGYLSKGEGGCFPVIKTVWGCPGFDFQKQMDNALAKWNRIAEIDKQEMGFKKYGSV